MAQQDAAALPSTSVTMNGKTLTLKMGYLCLVTLQKHWKLKSYREVQAHIAENMEDLSIIGDLIWGMTRSKHPDLTVDDIVAWIDSAPDIGTLMEKLGEAIEASTPPTSPKEGQTG